MGSPVYKNRPQKATTRQLLSRDKFQLLVASSGLGAFGQSTLDFLTAQSVRAMGRDVRLGLAVIDKRTPELLGCGKD